MRMWLKIEGDSWKEGSGEDIEAIFNCWDANRFARIKRHMQVRKSDLDTTPENYTLSTNTLNAEVIWKKESQH